MSGGVLPGRRWALVTDDTGGQSRSALAAVRALGVAGYEVAVSVSGPRSLAAASRYCSARVRVPLAGSAGYADALREEAASSRYTAVFPSSDTAVLAVEAPAAELVDKSRLVELAAQRGLGMPPSQIFPSGPALAAASGQLAFPVVVKPAVKIHGAYVPAGRADHPASLSAWATVASPLVVQPFIRGPISATAGVMWDGELRAVVHQRYRRTWPDPCGTASYAETVDPDPALEERMVALLPEHRGVFQAQFVGGHLIDVNPRVYGSLPLAVAAGANLPAIAAAAATGTRSRLVRGRAGSRYRWLEGDLRTTAHALRHRQLGAREAIAAVLPRPRTAHSVEAWNDPLPILTRLAHVIAMVRA